MDTFAERSLMTHTSGFMTECRSLCSLTSIQSCYPKWFRLVLPYFGSCSLRGGFVLEYELPMDAIQIMDRLLEVQETDTNSERTLERLYALVMVGAGLQCPEIMKSVDWPFIKRMCQPISGNE